METNLLSKQEERIMWEIIDLGRSDIRTIDKLKKTYRVFSSAYIEISASEKLIEEGNPYEVFRIDEAPVAGIKGRTFVKGLTMNHYNASTNLAGSDALKTNQENSYINFAYTMATALVRAEMPKVNAKTRSAVCIPVSEHYSANKDVIKSNLCGAYSITFPAINETYVFEIEPQTMAIAPEGVTAYFPLRKTSDKNRIKSSKLVIIDMGHGSLDITVVDRDNVLTNTSRSFSTGGQKIELDLEKLLEANGHGTSKDNVLTAIKYGWIHKGLTLKDVSDLVVEVKHKVADSLVKYVSDVLSTSGISKDEIGFFYFVGRPFIPSLCVGDNYNTGSLKEIFLEKWPVKEVEAIPTITPISADESKKGSVRYSILPAEYEALKDEEVLGQNARVEEVEGDYFLVKDCVLTEDNTEVIPEEVVNVTGLYMMV